MKTKRVVLSAVLVLVLTLMTSCLSSCGEPTEKTYFQGRVIEDTTGMPLSNVTVYLDGIPYETSSDAHFIFSELEPGKEYNVKISRQYFEDINKTIIAVYPSVDEDIKMKLQKTAPENIPNVKKADVSKLKSFDFEIEFGLSPTEVTVKESGTYVAPESYSYEMQSKDREEKPAMPGSDQAAAEEQAKPKFKTSKCIEIGARQWIDAGDGFKLNSRFHPGFRDIFGLVKLGVVQINAATSRPMFISDEGTVTIYGHNAKKVKALTIIDDPEPGNAKQTEKLLIEFTASIIDEGELIGVPVEMEVSSYRSTMQVKTWSKVTLSNFNAKATINPPLK